MKNKETVFQAIPQTLAEDVSRIQYGETSVTVKIHAGRAVSVTHSLTESIRETISDNEVIEDVKNV